MKQSHSLPRLRCSFLAVVWALSSVAALADNPVTLNIHLSDGTVQSIQLYTRPQVTFEGDRVVFTSPVATFSYDAQQVLRFTYSGGSLPDKVTSPETKELYRQTDEQFIFDAKVKASDIQLFSEDGKRMPVNLKRSGNHATLSLTSLPAGVYMLSVNGRTSKVVKK